MEFKFQRHVVASSRSFLFPPHRQSAWKACSQATIQNRPYVRPPLDVNGCEMANLLAGSPRNIIPVSNLELELHVVINWHLSRKTIRWPMSHDCNAGSGIQLINMTYFLVPTSFWFSIDCGLRSISLRWNSVCLLLTAKVELLEKDFWPWLNLYIITLTMYQTFVYLYQ